MKNVFERHGLANLSPSRINTFITNPAMCLLNIAGFKDSAGPSAWRGTSVDKAVTKAGMDRKAKDEIILSFAHQVFDHEHSESVTAVEFEKICKERATIEKYMEHAIPWVRTLPEITSAQGKVIVQYDEIPVPVLGFYDLLTDDHVRDLKTTASTPKSLSQAHCRQLAVYWKGTKGREPWVDYISKKEVRSFRVDNIQYWERQFILAAKALERILSHSDDIYECCQLVYPDLDHWMWSSTMKKTAKDVWNMEGLTL